MIFPIAQIVAARSYLFVPGNRPDRFAKARAAAPDVVIVDLEDAVSQADKVPARAGLEASLSAAHPVMVRVNSVNSQWFRDDIALCRAANIAGIVLPKAETTEDLRFLAEQLGSSIPILPMIETARGFDNVLSLATAPQVQRLIFGSIDFQIDLGIHGDDSELLYFRSHLVLISRLAGICAPVDGVTTDIHSIDRLHTEALRSRRLGFGGKLCIHPKQVGVVNNCFGPSAEEQAWATRVTAAAAATHGGALSVDGQMIDRPLIARAEAILATINKKR